jgi:hypothetical protein
MDHQTAVSDSREALEVTLRFGSRHLGSDKWEPTAPSEATDELANTETGSNSVPWGENPPRTAYAAANLMMTGVLDNLAALGQLLDDKMPVIAPTIIARSAIEILSSVWWLMEPGIGVRRRVCRELALSLTSARRAKEIADEFQSQGLTLPSEVAAAAQDEARVLKRIADLAIAPPTAGWLPKVGTEQAKSETKATAAMLKAVIPPTAPPEFVYRAYSAVTHGQIYGLMNFTAPGVSSDGSGLRHWHLPPEVLDSTVQVTIGAFREVYGRINKVMGWGKLEGDLWEIKLWKIYSR